MLRHERAPGSSNSGPVSDLELGIAAVLLAVLVLATTVLVPIIG